MVSERLMTFLYLVINCTFKVPIIVHEAICVAIWREKVLPEVLCIIPNPTQSFTLYFIVRLSIE